MIYQTDPEFACRPQIRHGGCFFLAILRALSDRFGLPFTHLSVLDFYGRELADSDTDVDNEMFIGDPQNLIDDYLGPGKVHYLGFAPSIYPAKQSEIEWGCWHQEGTDFNHFTYGALAHNPIYDPWSAEGSASVAQGVLISKRIALIL